MDDAVLDRLRGCSSPMIADAIEKFRVRPRDTGYTDGSIRCMFPALGRIVGFAATVRIRSMPERSPVPFDDLLEHVVAQPGPAVLVVEDVDDPPGRGAAWGEVNTSLLGALGCVGVVTNGAVRDLAEVEAAGFQMFASSVCVSHGQVQILDLGSEVTVGGLTIAPGDLLHADRHGVITVPDAIADQVPEVAAKERRVLEISRGRSLSLAELEQALSELS